ncbi:MAG: hypothetical protein KA250_00105 [Verrucomicrobiales bacterium]|nr:hypothetical protein [Verrucomicrobiales bacterium]HQZ26513.1 hypothetical protein [Verrucomicrobiales bacterium]
MRILLFLLACAGLLSAVPPKTGQRLSAGNEPVRIVCIGGSITLLTQYQKPSSN